ncbi:MAG: hypothetical protein Q9160_006127 [Pyrenula sp. 1 TL-2023]
METATRTQEIAVDGKKYIPIHEGLASILTPSSASDTAPGPDKAHSQGNKGDQHVFYNPVQRFNRDLSVLAILIYGQSASSARAQNYEKGVLSRKNKRRQKAKQKDTVPRQIGGVSIESQPKTAPSAAGGAPVLESSNKDNKLANLEENVHQEVPSGAKRKRDEIEENVDEAEAGLAKKQCIEHTESHGDPVRERPNAEQLQTNGENRDILDTVSTKKAESENPAKEVNGIEGSASKEIEKDNDNKPLPFSILDALSATGLRALRYAKEIPLATHIVANDISPDAIKAIRLNIKHNEVESVVQAHTGDARAYMYQPAGNGRDADNSKHNHRFDVIDLDPYGTAAPFFDAALQGLKDGGLLCVTCTDAGVWASNGYPEKSFSLYGGIPLKGFHSHEGGLRMILHAIATSAARYSIGIEPLLSLSVDFYGRLFIRIHKRQSDVKLLANKTMIVYNCDHGCGSWTTQKISRAASKSNVKGEEIFKHSYAQAPSTTPNCEHCGFKTHLSGPMWAGPLHNSHFIQRILDTLPTLDKASYTTTARIEGVLTSALEEDLDLHLLPDEAASSQPTESQTPAPTALSTHLPKTHPATTERYPFFFSLSSISKVLHATQPSEHAFRGALRHLGYRVTRSHCKPGSIRTDAPWSVLWEVMREWIRQKSPIKEGALKEGAAGWTILRRMRGSEARGVEETKEGIGERLKGAKTKADLKSELEAALFRLGRGAGAGKDDAAEGSEGSEELKKLGKLEVVFDEKLGKEKKLKKRLVRYQMNPTPNWGPMNRASGGGAAREES